MSADRLPEIPPEILTFQGPEDVITEIKNRDGEVIATGLEARQYNLNEFRRVMSQAGFSREDSPRDYCRTTAETAVKPTSDWQRHQTECADSTAFILEGMGIGLRPFSSDASRVLLFPSAGSIEGDDGTTTV